MSRPYRYRDPHHLRGWRRYLLPSGLLLLGEDETVRLMLVGVLVGVIGGVSAAGFDWVMIGVGKLLLHTAEPAVDTPARLWAFLGPVLTGAIAGIAVAWGTRNRVPSTISTVIDATWNRGGKISSRDGLVTAIGAACIVGGGQSGGREGPLAQLAASGTSLMCRRLKIPASRARVLVAAGAGAAMAASFNTPIGGAFFAMEIILGNFALRMFGPVVAASVTGTVVGQVLMGQRIALHLPTFVLRNPIELVFYLVLGALCGGVAVAFKRSVGWARSIKLPIHPALRPVLSGVAVGAVAAGGLHQIMGNGYAWMEQVVTDGASGGLGLLVLILVAKLFTAVATNAGRGGAGIFAPSLFMGAATGMIFGTLVHTAWPGLTEFAGAYGMVGMGAVVGAVTNAPITMTLMLFEMTRNYQIILPLLLTLAVAGVVAGIFDPESEYIAALRARGVEIRHQREKLVMYDLHVRDLMRAEDIPQIVRTAPFRDLANLFLHHRVTQVFVVDERGRFEGVVDIQDIKTLLATSHHEMTVAEVETTRLNPLRAGFPLAEAVPQFFRADAEELPVVDREGRLVGVLSERDVLGAYDREVLHEEALLARIESGEGEDRRVDFLELPQGHVVRSVEVTGQLTGRTLRDVKLPQRYHCTALAVIQVDPETGTQRRLQAAADILLQEGDRVVVMGPEPEVEALCSASADLDETADVPRSVLAQLDPQLAEE